MDDSIQLANEKISQLMGELSHQTFDTYLILTRKGSDGYFELLFDKVTQQPCAAVFRRSGNHCLLVHESEAGLFVGLRGIAVRAYSGDFFGAFREVMDQEPIEKLALDFSEDDASADGLSLGLFTYVFRYSRMPMEELEERITSAAEMMDTVRAQKSPSELRRLEESIRLAEDCISACKDQIRQGMTELEISDLFVREMKKRGLVSSEGGGPDVPPMLLNLRGGMSHRGPMAVKTLPGDVLILDFFCWYKGTAEKGMPWYIATAPSANWANYLFPELSTEEGVAKLWDILFDVCLVDENDPIKNWLGAMGENGKYAGYLNAHGVDSIHFHNNRGTDITVGFQKGVFWVGGGSGEYTPQVFLPNIPTAEVSSSPDKYRVNGTVAASRPLMLNGTVVENFGFTFHDGRVVDFYAEKGYEALKSALETDEGALYLGEVAFVPCDSPLAKTGLLFMETLLDENAACHMALGRGFNILFRGLSGTDLAEWDRVNLNHSAIHVDFMFGTEDMTADIRFYDGTQQRFFVNGKFNPEIL